MQSARSLHEVTATIVFFSSSVGVDSQGPKTSLIAHASFNKKCGDMCQPRLEGNSRSRRRPLSRVPARERDARPAETLCTERFRSCSARLERSPVNADFSIFVRRKPLLPRLSLVASLVVSKVLLWARRQKQGPAKPAVGWISADFVSTGFLDSAGKN